MTALGRTAISKTDTLVLLMLFASVLSFTAFGRMWVIDVAILGAAAGIVIYWLSGQDGSIKLPRSIVVPVAVIWALFLLSSITATSSLPESVLRAVAAIVISGVGIFIIPKIYNRRLFLLHILSISFVLGLLSVLAVVTPLKSIGRTEMLRAVTYESFILLGPSMYRPVPVAGLGNPNTLATALIPGILAGMAYFRERTAERSIRGILVFAIATIIPTVALVLTRSRGGLLSLVAGVAMYLAVHHLSSVAVRVLCLFGIASTVLFLVPIETGSVPSLIELVSEPRAWLWEQTLDAILQRPFLGYGVGNSRIAIPESQAQPHNAYFMLGAWSGIFVLVAYLYLFAQTLLLSVQNRTGASAAVFSAILTSYWTISIFESINIFHLTVHSIILAVTFGFVADSTVIEQKYASQKKLISEAIGALSRI